MSNYDTRRGCSRGHLLELLYEMKSDRRWSAPWLSINEQRCGVLRREICLALSTTNLRFQTDVSLTTAMNSSEF